MALVSILIPAFNEEKTISDIIERLAVLDLGKEHAQEIIVVDDASSDDTACRALSALNGLRGRVITHPRNRGKGGAVKTALAEAQGEAVIIQDADLEYDPADIPACVLPILDGKSDVVYGSRRLNKENRKHSSWLFFAGGGLVTSVFNLLYGGHLTDEPTCYKAFRRTLLENLNFVSEGFEWEPEVTAKLALAKVEIIEVPISYKPRVRSEGKKITWGDGIRAVTTLLSVRFRGH